MYLAVRTERRDVREGAERRLLRVGRVLVRLHQTEKEVHGANTEALTDIVAVADVPELRRKKIFGLTSISHTINA